MDNLETTFTKVMDNFRSVSSIPRCSGREKKISDFLTLFGRNLGLETRQDEALNVIIKKPGTTGYENSPPVILQGHMDMVCVGDNDDGTGFEDGITFIEEDGLIRAEGTSLGADNGIALAYIMTLLESNGFPHPPIEALFTTSEETGMDGAIAVEPSWLHGKTLINLDSEDEGVLTVSCAGGITAVVDIPFETKPVKENDLLFSIKIGGLKGGHSGAEIHKQRANAIKLMGRVLYGLDKSIKYSLVTIKGGTKLNAIPVQTQSIIAVKPKYAGQLIQYINEYRAHFSNEFSESDAGVTVSCHPADSAGTVKMTGETGRRIVRTIMLIPDGVQDMSMKIPGLVRTSNNLGVVSTNEDSVKITCLVRSSVGSKKTHITDTISCVAESVKAYAWLSNDYPEWQYAEASRIRDICIEVYSSIYGNKPEIRTIHAGLECGILGRKLSNVDMISFGPDIEDAHTTYERMSTDSARRTWKYLCSVLERLR